jgi:hypothetical protein
MSFSSRMRDIIASWQEDSDDSARYLAAGLYKHLRDTDPGLLAGWEQELALLHLSAEFHHRRGSQRQAERREAGRILARYHSVFADKDASPADRRRAAMEVERLTTFSTRMVVSEEGKTREIGKMTRADCEYVASRFRRAASRDGLWGTFYEQVAGRLTSDRTVEQVFSINDFVTLRASIVDGK